MNPIQNFYSLSAYKILQAMKKRNIEAYFCETKAEALEKALDLTPKGATVAFGGSQSLIDVGLLEELRVGDYNLIDRDTAKTAEEIDKIFHDSLSCDYYFMGSNAVTIDGKLINIDGIGNRIAALIYGPKNVIVIAGMNKVETDEKHAILRARKFAAPVNAIRLQRNTPCVSTGMCHRCNEDDCICSHILVTRMSRPKNRIKVILVGERLGF